MYARHRNGKLIRKPVYRSIPEWTPCGYCFQNWAIVWDHIIPASRGGSNDKSNLEPACYRCNLMLKARVFPSLAAKKEWIRALLIKRGLWKFPEEVNMEEGEFKRSNKTDEATEKRYCEGCGKELPKKYTQKRFCNN